MVSCWSSVCVSICPSVVCPSIWFGIANGQISSIFDWVTCPQHSNCGVFHFLWISLWLHQNLFHILNWGHTLINVCFLESWSVKKALFYTSPPPPTPTNHHHPINFFLCRMCVGLEWGEVMVSTYFFSYPSICSGVLISHAYWHFSFY